MKKIVVYIIVIGLSLCDIQLFGQSDPGTPLFEIKNDLGQTVFAVYPGGVHIFVDDDTQKAVGGGFKVGRIGTEKAAGDDIFTVIPGEVNVYLDNTQKAVGGGFKVGRIGTEKATGDSVNYLTVTPDSTRIYVEETSTSGFAVGKLGSTDVTDFLNLTPDNTFIGNLSGVNQQEGADNIYIGNKSGENILGGERNIYIGKEAGFNADASINTVAIGYQSGYSNTEDNNTFVGPFSGQANNTGRENVYLGHTAGQMIESGERNVIIGAWAGHSGPKGINNVIIGAYAGNVPADSISGNVIIGSFTGRTNRSSNRLYIDNYNTSAPLIYGEFDNDVITINGSLFYRDEFSQTSDQRLKTNLVRFTNSLQLISQLNAYYFNWNEKAISDLGYKDKKQVGLLAQDVEKLIPELVTTTPDGYKAVDYVKLTPVLIEAVKEQNEQITNLQERVTKLEASNESLKEELNKMKQLQSDIEELKKAIKELREN